MPRMPGAIWKPITAKNRSRMIWYRRVNLHVAVSETTSLHAYFNAKGRPDSHFYVRKDGTIEQYVDTAYQAYCDLQGNDATISIETQGGVRNTSTEKWTPAQVTSLARIYAWAVKTHGIPLKIASDSKVAASSHGLSWHRLGIDGNFPALPSVLAGRRQRGGGMHYTKSVGKVCPGDAKIRQVADVFNAAKQILGGATAPPKPPTPPKENEDDMPKLTDRIALSDSAKRHLNRDHISYGGSQQYAAAGGWEAMNRLPRMEATLKALAATVDVLAKSQGADSAAITKAVEEAVTEALRDLEITLSVEG